MYLERKGNISWFRGCGFNCKYCAFNKTLRYRKCQACKDFTPHAHLEVLDRAPPKTRKGEFLTMGLTGDISFASSIELAAAISYCKRWNDRTFMVQTKDPGIYKVHEFPENVILNVTIETDVDFNISQAPTVDQRLNVMESGTVQRLPNRKYITIEPIMGFSVDFVNRLKMINPDVVYIGYDSEQHKIIEPSLEATKKLVDQLRSFVEVRTKLLRKAHWEL